jgi:hypothetical protein
MRKVILLVLLMTGVCKVKAQIVIPPRVSDTLSNSLFKNHPNKKPDTLGSQFFKPFKWTPTPMKRIDNRLATQNEDVSPIDNMPIARLHTNSNMPVVKPSGYSKMPVVDPRGNQWPDFSKPFGDNSK